MFWKKSKEKPERLSDRVYTSFDEVAEFIYEHQSSKALRPVGEIKKDFELVTKGDIKKVRWALVASYLSNGHGTNYEWIPHWIKGELAIMKFLTPSLTGSKD